MKIFCRKCNYAISAEETMVYVTGFLIQKGIEIVTVKTITHALLELIQSKAKRGTTDNILSGIANLFFVKCPECESVAHWSANQNDKIEKKAINVSIEKQI